MSEVDENTRFEVAESLRRWTARRGPTDNDDFAIAAQNTQPTLVRQETLIRALRYLRDREGVGYGPDSRVLDVGSGSGYGLLYFLVPGFSETQLYGVDLMPDRIEQGLKAHPGLNLTVGDGTAMEFDDAFFDLTCEQFCFCHVMDDSVREKTAAEMLRVTKPGGHIIVFDWLYSRRSWHYNGVPKREIKALFGAGADPIVRFRGHVIPPIGRTLSKYTPALYPLAQLMPFLVASRLTVLRRH